MDDLQLLEAVERYMEGKMPPDERLYFESLRKSNPEIDQAVVEHTFFMQQLNRFDAVKKLKGGLNDIHIDLAEKGAIRSPRLRGKAKVVYLFNRYKRTAAIAASIAGITAIGISALLYTVAPGKPATKSEVQALSRKVNGLINHNRAQDREISNVKNKIDIAPVSSSYVTGGTSFLIDAKGYLVTNAHIVEGARSILVQNSKGQDLAATVIFTDKLKDLAILKIEDTAFKAPATLGYSIKRGSADIAEQVYTLGFPRNEIVYGEGYLAAKTGFKGDTLTLQIAIAANPGNSGGPILNANGEVIGILSTKQTTAEGAVFATQSKFIFEALKTLQKEDTTYKNIKIPAASSMKGWDRMQQVKKIADNVYMVKVN
jgi:S1-C subfamily serine protease